MARKTTRRILIALGACVLLLLLLVGLLPTLLSMGPARRAVLSRINDKISEKVGTLTVEDWSLGWLSGVSADGIGFCNPQRTMVMHADRLTVAAGIPGLLRSTKDIGHVELLRPEVELTAPTPSKPGAGGSVPPGSGKPGSAGKDGGTSAPDGKTPDNKLISIPIDIKGTIDIRDGMVSIKSGDAARSLQVSNINVSVGIESLNRPTDFKMSSLFSTGGGLSAEGSVKLLSDGVLDPAAVAVDATVKLNRFPIGAAVAMANASGALPDTSGTLSAEVDIKMEGIERLRVNSKVVLSSLLMKGGPLKKDSFALDKLTFDMETTKAGRTVNVKTFRLDSPVATATASGDLVMPESKGLPQGQFTCTGRVDIASILSQLRNTVQLKEGMSITGGTLDLDGQVSSTGKKQSYNANVRLHGLTGTLAGRGAVELSKPVTLSAKASRDEKGPRLDAFSLTSSFASGHGSGALDNMDANITADLAGALAEAKKFADLGELKTSGTAVLDIHLKSASELRKDLAASLSVRDVEFSKPGIRPIKEPKMDAKIAATLHLDPKSKGLSMHVSNVSLDLTSSPANATVRIGKVAPPSTNASPAAGESKLEVADLKLDASVNLARLTDIAESVVTNLPPGMRAAGTAKLTCSGGMSGNSINLPSFHLDISPLTFQQTGMKAIAAVTLDGSVKDGGVKDGGWRRSNLSATLALKNLDVTREGMRPIAEPNIEGKFSGVMDLSPNPSTPAVFSDLAVDIASSPASAGLRVAKLTLRKSATGAVKPEGSDIKADLTGDLAKLMDLASAVVTNLPPGLRLEGTAKLACSGGISDGAISIPSVALSITPLVFEQGGKRIREKSLRLAAKASANLAERSVKLPEATLDFSPGSLKLSDVVLPDWSKLPAGAKAHLEGKIDIATLLAVAGDFVKLSTNATVEGQMALNLDLSARDSKQEVKVNTTLTGVKFRSAKAKPVEEDRIDLSASAGIDANAGNVSLENLKLASQPLSVSATGALKDWKKSKMLDAKGDITCDFERIASIVNILTGQQIDMAGKKSEPFVVKTSLSGKTWQEILRQTQMSAGMYVDRLSLFGVTLGKTTLPVTTANGLAQAKMDAVVNEGKLVAAPEIDVTGKIPTLRLPANSQVLARVKLNDEMSNKLLANIHPLFRGCAATSGNMDLSMTRLMVPLDETMNQKTEFEGRITLRGVTLQASGLLGEVLGLMREANKQVSLTNLPINFVCKNGRISADPVTVHSGENTLTFSGTVGLDQTLDYAVEVPITRALTGKDVYDLLHGQKIRVPIGGTVSNPRLDRSSFEAAIGGLLKKAAASSVEKTLENEAGKLLQKWLKQ